MPVWAYFFIAMLVAAVAIAVASQVIGPSKLRRRFTEEMARRGWTAVTPGVDEDWEKLAGLAVHAAIGPEARFEYAVPGRLTDEKGTIARRQSAVPAAAFRDPGGRHPRFAAAGSRMQVERHRYQVAGLSSGSASWSKAHELWVGEARLLPVSEPGIVFSSLYEIGRGLPGVAKNPGALGLPPLLEGELAERVRALLRERQAVLRLGPTVYAGPAGWVLVTMIRKSMPRLAELLDLSIEIGQALDTTSARGRTA